MLESEVGLKGLRTGMCAPTGKSALTYTMGTNLENLTLLGKVAIPGTGNTEDNMLLGNNAVNTLTGNAGNDWSSSCPYQQIRLINKL